MDVATRGRHVTHQVFNGVLDDLVPVVDDGVGVVLYQILRALTSLQLQEDTWDVELNYYFFESN